MGNMGYCPSSYVSPPDPPSRPYFGPKSSTTQGFAKCGIRLWCYYMRARNLVSATSGVVGADFSGSCEGAAGSGAEAGVSFLQEGIGFVFGV